MARDVRGMASTVLRRLGLSRGSRPPGDLPPDVARAWRYVRRFGLTYLSDARLASIARLALEADRAPADAVFIEAGCALGGSTIILCSAKSPRRPLRVYDVFGTIPAPGAGDGADAHERYRVIASGESRGIRGDQYYGYRSDLYETVARNIERAGCPLDAHNVSLVRGLLQSTLTGDDRVAFAHIDVDWYDPVRTCLERIVPRLVPGGVLVVDDYNDWSGCKSAVDEYFAGVKAGAFTLDTSAGHLVVRKQHGA
jgi:O-methyltransferase